MRLLDKSLFAPIFEDLKGLRVGIVDGFGNVGDDLLYLATRRFCQEFGVDHFTVNALAEDTIPKCDKLLLFAGGNVGYPKCAAIRKKAFESGIPCWMLPQSVFKKEDLPFERLYFRDSVSRDIIGRGDIVPDLALGFDFPEVICEKSGDETFLRKTGETVFQYIPPPERKDPAFFCHTPQQYWEYAATLSSVKTDRLHFAICSLAMGVKTTLLPVYYHKNKTMHNEYLNDLGCFWSDSVYNINISPVS